ncbi:unnamed protein product [[Candida] boidinii]|uniref:Unnamed protein product n=1 Tax=Candida boidinii TaxID=5477 RepID=A0ACB5U4G3_CANBO|nr:unnamed protein product [[Candida] boidinii]
MLHAPAVKKPRGRKRKVTEENEPDAAEKKPKVTEKIAEPVAPAPEETAPAPPKKRRGRKKKSEIEAEAAAAAAAATTTSNSETPLSFVQVKFDQTPGDAKKDTPAVEAPAEPATKKATKPKATRGKKKTKKVPITKN